MRIERDGRSVYLSYSTNVHPAESLEALTKVITTQVAAISREAFGVQPAAVNLRLGARQVDELLAQSALPSLTTLTERMLSAPPTERCLELKAALKTSSLYAVSVNGFPIRDFHAQRVKEQVYEPSWLDLDRALYTFKIAKVLAQLLEDEHSTASVSVPAGCFKRVGDDEGTKTLCAQHIVTCARELIRLERATGKTIVLGLEPEPFTTGESIAELLDYFEEYIFRAAQSQWPTTLGVDAAQAEALVRRFVTVNLDLCHQAVEFEDPVEDLKLLKRAGIALSGLHISAALKLEAPAQHREARMRLQQMDEPRYLHQLVAQLPDGTLRHFADLPEVDTGIWEQARELRCHFHVPLFAAFDGALQTTRDSVAPAVRFAWTQGLTDNFVVETYTWGVLNEMARTGNTAVQAIVGPDGLDLPKGLVRELQWAHALFQ